MATTLADTDTLKRNAIRSAVLASADASFRDRVRDALVGMRWRVMEASGGAEALAYLDAEPVEAMILDSWPPDLEIREFVGEFRLRYPGVDLISVDEDASSLEKVRSPRRNELLYALRKGQDADGAIWNSAPVLSRPQFLPFARQRIAQSPSGQMKTAHARSPPGQPIWQPSKQLRPRYLRQVIRR
jgi:hypothetical protein